MEQVEMEEQETQEVRVMLDPQERVVGLEMVVVAESLARAGPVDLQEDNLEASQLAVLVEEAEAVLVVDLVAPAALVGAVRAAAAVAVELVLVETQDPQET